VSTAPLSHVGHSSSRSFCFLPFRLETLTGPASSYFLEWVGNDDGMRPIFGEISFPVFSFSQHGSCHFFYLLKLLELPLFCINDGGTWGRYWSGEYYTFFHLIPPISPPRISGNFGYPSFFYLMCIWAYSPPGQPPWPSVHHQVEASSSSI